VEDIVDGVTDAVEDSVAAVGAAMGATVARATDRIDEAIAGAADAVGGAGELDEAVGDAGTAHLGSGGPAAADPRDDESSPAGGRLERTPWLDRSALRALPGVGVVHASATAPLRGTPAGGDAGPVPDPAPPGGGMPSMAGGFASSVRDGPSPNVAVLAAALLISLAVFRRSRREGGLRITPGFPTLSERPG
jgi:hypothetical protein